MAKNRRIYAESPVRVCWAARWTAGHVLRLLIEENRDGQVSGAEFEQSALTHPGGRGWTRRGRHTCLVTHRSVGWSLPQPESSQKDRKEVDPLLFAMAERCANSHYGPG
ncbi:hypothetical protein [Streptomyces tauricus]|uniref:hypothetical protein n=1 Tax=Streptomyces tauricus TaxID=68274 RepID=UPI002242CB86|nr:hypothetical protein [Streptomyces tauricus]MCW8103332.1 hypothetical protein [Streptomyces tauricus]